ncbi:MAG: molybdenum cofactor biosynthesis protein MoaE [Gammaproteobacteria bacterium]|nr:molybdenum cofactor biosynthesis protein MoaE [Gammaproteobacteria bacterium]
MAHFDVSESPIDVAALRGLLLGTGSGAYASFEGWVRDRNDGRAVLALTYESYRALAEAEGKAILAEASTRFDIQQVACVHRVGRLELGELAVWVGVSAAHRGPAFDACRWIIDEVKSRVPIWKHEHYAQGGQAWLHPSPRDSGG